MSENNKSIATPPVSFDFSIAGILNLQIDIAKQEPNDGEKLRLALQHRFEEDADIIAQKYIKKTHNKIENLTVYSRLPCYSKFYRAIYPKFRCNILTRHKVLQKLKDRGVDCDYNSSGYLVIYVPLF